MNPYPSAPHLINMSKTTQWSWRWNSSGSWKFSTYLCECHRSCTALTASIIHPQCPQFWKSTAGWGIQICHFAWWNTKPFKLEALDGFDPPPAYSTPSKPEPPGIYNAAIIFITLTVKRQTCSSLSAWAHSSTSELADAQVIFIFYICVPLHYPAWLSSTDLSSVNGAMQKYSGLYFSVCIGLFP